MTLLDTRNALLAFGSVYVTSLHKLTETGQTLSFLSQNPECISIPILYKYSNLSGLNHVLSGLRLIVRLNRIFP
ncbi:hypothetical protein Hanom_Chr02g00138291 [Helianthus anomalus]